MTDKHQGVTVPEEIYIKDYLHVIRRAWWAILSLTLLVGIITSLVVHRLPDTYRVTAVIAPAPEENKKNFASGFLLPFGISVGGATKVEDLESLFKSRDLTVRVFSKYPLWPIVFQKNFDSKTGKVQVGWFDRFRDSKVGWRDPDDWDAIRTAEDNLKISINRKSGSLTISFDSESAEGSAQIVRHYLDEAKSRLQEEAQDRAGKNMKFIEDQIAKTVDLLKRERLYSMYGQEVEQEMMARNRTMFGFRIVDSPRAPKRASSPQRLKIVGFATGIALPFWTVALAPLFRKRPDRQTERVRT